MCRKKAEHSLLAGLKINIGLGTQVSDTTSPPTQLPLTRIPTSRVLNVLRVFPALPRRANLSPLYTLVHNITLNHILGCTARTHRAYLLMASLVRTEQSRTDFGLQPVDSRGHHQHRLTARLSSRTNIPSADACILAWSG